MKEIKFKFYTAGVDVLEVMEIETGETVKLQEPSEIAEFLDWNITDIYVFEWTIGEDILGLFS